MFLMALLILNWPPFLPSAAAQGRRGGNPVAAGVYKSQIIPNWFADNTHFWYRNDSRGGEKEFILVDAVAGTRRPAFDHQRLAAALSKPTGKTFDADHLPFNAIDFIDDLKAIRFQLDDALWKCNLDSYELTQPAATPSPANQERAPPFHPPTRREDPAAAVAIPLPAPATANGPPLSKITTSLSARRPMERNLSSAPMARKVFPTAASNGRRILRSLSHFATSPVNARKSIESNPPRAAAGAPFSTPIPTPSPVIVSIHWN